MVQSVKFKRVGGGYHPEEVLALRRLGVHALEALTGYHKELRVQSKLAWAGKPSTVPEEPQLQVEILQLRSSHLHSRDDGFDTAQVTQFRRDMVAGIVWWQSTAFLPNASRSCSMRLTLAASLRADRCRPGQAAR